MDYSQLTCSSSCLSLCSWASSCLLWSSSICMRASSRPLCCLRSLASAIISASRGSSSSSSYLDVKQREFKIFYIYLTLRGEEDEDADSTCQLTLVGLKSCSSAQTVLFKVGFWSRSVAHSKTSTRLKDSLLSRKRFSLQMCLPTCPLLSIYVSANLFRNNTACVL